MIYPGRRAPQPFIRNVELETIGNQTHATVYIAYKNTGKSGRNAAQGHDPKSHTPQVTSNLKMAVIRLSSELLLYKLTSPRARSNIMNSFLKKSRTPTGDRPDTYEVRNISFRNANQRFADNGFTTVFTEKFIIPSNSPQHLSFCVISHYNDESREHQKVPPSVLNSFSSIAVETVIFAGRTVRRAVFFSPSSEQSEQGKGKYFSNTPAGEVWTGPFHIMQNGRIMTGERHGGQEEYLNANEIYNTTLRDFRDLDLINNININLRGNSPTNQRIKGKNAAFSDMLLTKDEFNNIKFLFDIDFARLLVDKIQYPSLIANIQDGIWRPAPSKGSFNEVLDLCKIRSITIKKRKLTNKSQNKSLLNNLISDAKVQKIDDSVPEEIVVVGLDRASMVEGSSARRHRNLETREQTGEIKEITGNIYFIESGRPGNKIRTFTGTDFLDSPPGIYCYSVEIEIVDGSKEWLENRLKGLESSYKELQQYRSQIERLAKITPRSSELDILKKIETDGQTYIRNSKGPWHNAVVDLFRLISVFSNGEENFVGKDGRKISTGISQRKIQSLKFSLALMAHPKTASIKSIDLLIATCAKFIKKFESIRETQKGLLSRSSAEKSAQTPGQGSRLPNPIIVVEHKFGDIIDTKNLNNIGYDYITTINRTPTKGLQTVDEAFYKQRVVEENERFFKNIAEAGVIMAETPHENNLRVTEMTFLAPSALRLPNRLLRTYSNNPKDKFSENRIMNDHILNIVDYKNHNRIPQVDFEKEQARKFEEAVCTTSTTKKIKARLLNAISFDNVSIGRRTFDIKSSDEERENHGAMAGLSAEETRLFNSELEKDEIVSVKNQIPDRVDPSEFIKSLIFLKTFDISKELCSLDYLNSTSERFLSKSEQKYLPNQLKSIITSSVNPEAVVNGVFNAEGKFSIDIVSYLMNYKNLATIEFQNSFRNSHVKQRNWQGLTQAQIETASNGGHSLLLCRINFYNNPKIGYTHNKMLELPIYNEYFLLKLQKGSASAGRSVSGVRTGTVGLPMDFTFLREMSVDNEFLHTSLIQYLSKEKSTKPRGSSAAAPIPGTVATITATAAQTTGTSGMGGGY